LVAYEPKSLLNFRKISSAGFFLLPLLRAGLNRVFPGNQNTEILPAFDVKEGTAPVASTTNSPFYHRAAASISAAGVRFSSRLLNGLESGHCTWKTNNFQNSVQY